MQQKSAIYTKYPRFHRFSRTDDTDVTDYYFLTQR